MGGKDHDIGVDDNGVSAVNGKIVTVVDLEFGGEEEGQGGHLRGLKGRCSAVILLLGLLVVVDKVVITKHVAIIFGGFGIGKVGRREGGRRMEEDIWLWRRDGVPCIC